MDNERLPCSSLLLATLVAEELGSGEFAVAGIGAFVAFAPLRGRGFRGVVDLVGLRSISESCSRIE